MHANQGFGSYTSADEEAALMIPNMSKVVHTLVLMVETACIRISATNSSGFENEYGSQ